MVIGDKLRTLRKQKDSKEHVKKPTISAEIIRSQAVNSKQESERRALAKLFFAHG
jgi:hypothetical protein